MGGHTELSVFSSLDFSNFKEAGIRPIVFFTEERVDIFPNTPTALEKGIDFQYQTQYFWITPKGVSSEILDTLEIALEKASEDPETTSYFKTLGLISRFEQSEAIQTSLNKIRDRAAPVIEQMLTSDKKVKELGNSLNQRLYNSGLTDCPNNLSVPVLIYQEVFEAGATSIADQFESAFHDNGWTGSLAMEHLRLPPLPQQCPIRLPQNYFAHSGNVPRAEFAT